MRLRFVLRFCLAVLVLIGAAAARAAVVTYPGTAPCDTTLQACVTGTAAGNVVEIATSVPIVELVTVAQSLTLQPAAGFSPVVQGGFLVTGGATTTTVTLQGLTIQGSVTGLPGAGAFNLSVLDDVIKVDAPFGRGIWVTSGPTGPFGNVTADIRRNQITVTTPDFHPCSGIEFGPILDAGSDLLTILENTVTATGCGQGAGIQITNGAAEVLNAFVFSNRVVATGTNAGIFVETETPDPAGALTAQVVDNLVTGQTNIAGLPAAIGAAWSTGTTLTFSAVNNTVAGNQTGIAIDGDTPVGAFTGLVANNVIAFNTGEGFSVDPAFTVTNHHNVVFGNAGGDFFVAGPATLSVDPLFVGAGDFHLRPNSPAINAGDNSVLPSGAATDLDGDTRIVAGTVDAGAFEAQQVSAVSIPTLSPLGLAALGLGLAVVARAALRRRRLD